MCYWGPGLAASLIAVKVSFIGKEHYLGSQGDLCSSHSVCVILLSPIHLSASVQRDVWLIY